MVIMKIGESTLSQLYYMGLPHNPQDIEGFLLFHDSMDPIQKEILS